jgi:hypothetical protein
MKRFFRASGLALASLVVSAPLFGQAAPLLLTEFAVTPTAGEMAEIYNPGTETVDLTDVYITDATFQGGPTWYYEIVIGAPGGGSFGDFTARFPAGASIAPGEYQTVAFADAEGAEGFLATYGVLPTYECIGDLGADDPGVANMLEAVPGSINGTGGLTNSNEIVILFYWDGNSDLVTDLDYVSYGGSNETVDKTGVSIDGPDADSDTSTYADDTPLLEHDDAPSPGSAGTSAQRIMMSEGTEEMGGVGNGVNGNNETSENVSQTWIVDAPTPNGPTAGAVELLVTEASLGLYDFDVTGGTAGGLFITFANVGLSTTAIGQCPGEGLHVTLDGLEAVLSANLDGNGELSVTAHMPAGLSLTLQVVDATSCRFSQPVSITF